MPGQVSVGGLGGSRTLDLVDRRARPPEGHARLNDAQTRLIGRAETTGGPAALDDADPVEAARAVRRALAAAGRKAVEVDALVVAAPLVPTAETCRRLARRALGPHGEGIAAIGVAVAGDRAEDLALAAAAYLGSAATADGASVAEGWALAVCVGRAVDGTTVALCLCRSGQQRPGQQADDGPAEQQRDRTDPTA
jgi:hypothetical protein